MPLLICIGAINIFLGYPVFFFQYRPGYGEKLFCLIKFSTLDEGKNVTPFGKLLRKTSIDELPQLINILKGEMSFVGPRPLLASYLDIYTDLEQQRHTVKPGITGLAQVNGRNQLDFKQKMEFDIRYVSAISFKMDIWIVFKTLLQVFKTEEANALDQVKNVVG